MCWVINGEVIGSQRNEQRVKKREREASQETKLLNYREQTDGCRRGGG